MFEILTLILLAAVIGLLFVTVFLYRRIQEVEDFAVDKIAKLSLQVSEIPVEDLQAKYDAEKAWNEGVQNILNFGAKVSKGVTVNE